MRKLGPCQAVTMDKAESVIPDAPDEVSSGPTLDEEKIERSLVRKIDLHILPFVVLLYLFSFLDRGKWGTPGGLISDSDPEEIGPRHTDLICIQ